MEHFIGQIHPIGSAGVLPVNGDTVVFLGVAYISTMDITGWSTSNQLNTITIQ